MLWIRNDPDPDPTFQMVSNPYPDPDPVSVPTCICSNIHNKHSTFAFPSFKCVRFRLEEFWNFFYKKEFISLIGSIFVRT